MCNVQRTKTLIGHFVLQQVVKMINPSPALSAPPLRPATGSASLKVETVAKV